jgi:two-component system, OmpR family, phosphate regulon sensor histidine kinase PhoR
LKLVVTVLCVLITVLIGVYFFASKAVQHAYDNHLKTELLDKARVLSYLPEEQLRANVRVFGDRAGVRITILDQQGNVTADSAADTAKMENHANREEVQSAMRGQLAWSERVSHTLDQPMMYLALPYHAGILRLATPLSAAMEQVREIQQQVLQITAVAILPAALISLLFARYISRKLAAIIGYAGQLAKGDFEARLPNPGDDELGILGKQLNETGEKLQAMFEQLQREHTELEKLERIRKDFVINVSHELRTPLASIQGYTETLLDGALHDSEHNMRFLTIIRQNAERLARLTSDLLTLSRIELKTQKFQFASYYINHLLLDDVDTVRPMAAKKNINIILESAEEKLEVFCDAEAVHQILVNLLDNALKYTPEQGTIHVGVRIPAEGKHQNSEMVEVYVRDSGVGIPADDLPRLFERFYRVDKARSRELGGTGLGLAIVKHLVRAQGGEVGVSSILNQGSTFFFTLPMHDTGQQEAHDEAELSRHANSISS